MQTQFQIYLYDYMRFTHFVSFPMNIKWFIPKTTLSKHMLYVKLEQLASKLFSSQTL